jgi:hypothetical protein
VTIEVPGLGKIAEVPHSPPGERFWAGSFRYSEGGRQEISVFYLRVRGSGEPTPAQIEFAHTMLAAMDRHISGARELLAAKLRDDPGFFGADAATTARTLARDGAFLPFGVPEPSFYEPEEWRIRFAESPLPKCETFGVAVTFAGAAPVRIEDLSGSEPI